MKSKHDQYIDKLVRALSPKYEFICTNVEYKDLKTQKCGEIDILAKKGRYLDIIEVKCSGNYVKALEQLHRAKNALEAGDLEVRLMYYSGKKDCLSLVK